MIPESEPITVIGCGVIGLTSAIRLREAGHAVTIVARDLPPATTSNVAAAVWFPYKAFPLDRVLAWSRTSLDVYYAEALDPASGVQLATFIDLFDAPAADPWWREAVRRFWRPAPNELPAGYADGHACEAPVIETPVYMTRLVRRFTALGGRIERRAVRDLGAVAGAGRIVVNCAGLGARELAADPTVFPIRGQIVRLAKPPGVATVLFDEHGHEALAYVIPRGADVIVGGTAGVDEWRLTADAATAAEILARATRLEPRLAGAAVLEHLVGLRPGRPAVRLETEIVSGGRVIHNYGHGGAGFTLAWGCAGEVVTLVSGEPEEGPPRTQIRRA